jgi:hypothetical protein
MKKFYGIYLMIFILCQSNLLSNNNPEKLLGLGVGYGGSYAFLGGNIVVSPLDNVSFFASAGVIPSLVPLPQGSNSDVGQNIFNWGLGLRYSFLSNEYSFRPRAVCYYGYNSMTEHHRVHESGRIMGTFLSSGKGLAIGAGFSWRLLFTQNFYLDLDYHYALTSEPYIATENIIDNWEHFFPVLKTYPFTFSIGIRYTFDNF